MSLVRISTNLDDVQTGGVLVDPATYRVKIINADPAPENAKDGDKPCMEVDYEILDAGDFQGVSRRDWVYLTAASAWRLKGLLEATETPYTVDGDETIFDSDDLMGKELRVIISQEQKQNSSGMRNTIDGHLTAD